MSFHVNDGEGIQALYYNREVKRNDGWAVANMGSGSCAVQINTGTLGSTADTLTIQSGTALIDGTVTSISQQTQSIPEGGSDPRKDVVLLDSTGSVTRAAGYAEPISPSTATLADSERPAPPDLANTDCVVLAVILVDAGATSITSSEIVDQRAPADYEAVSLSTQSASGETLEALDQLGVPIYADALSAPAETVFFNSTLENLAFKDASGTVHEAVGELSSLTIDVDKDWQAQSISNVDEFRAAFATHQNTIDTDRTIPSGEGSVIAGSLSGTGTISGDGSLAVIDEGIHEKLDNPMAGDLDAAGYAITNAGSIETDALHNTVFVDPSSALDVQNAIDSLSTGRTWRERVVVLGSYTHDARVTVPSWTVLDLREADITVANGLDNNAFTAGDNAHIEVRGGTIDGNKANNTAGSIFRFNGCRDVLFEGVTVQDATDTGIKFLSDNRDSEDITIRQCTVTGTANREGLALFGSDPNGYKIRNVTVDGGTFNNNGSGSAGDGIELVRSREATVTGVTASGNSQDGIAFDLDAAGTAVGCTANNNGARGFSNLNTTSATRARLVECKADGNNHGVLAAAPVTIDGGEFTNNASDGIRIHDVNAAGSVVTGPRLSGNTNAFNNAAGASVTTLLESGIETGGSAQFGSTDFRSRDFTIADDAAVSFSVSATPILFIPGKGSREKGIYLTDFDSLTTVAESNITNAGGNTTLSGTTSTDGTLNVSRDDNTIYLENRTGAEETFTILELGQA